MLVKPLTLEPWMLSINQTFYPKGCVFAMFPTGPLATAAAADLGRMHGIADLQLAEPAMLTTTWRTRAEQISDNPPSVGREEQFQVRFRELAAQGQYGLLIRLGDDVDKQAAIRVLQQQRCSVAYRYGTLVIEDWVAPDTRAEAAGVDTL